MAQRGHALLHCICRLLTRHGHGRPGSSSCGLGPVDPFQDVGLGRYDALF